MPITLLAMICVLCQAQPDAPAPVDPARPFPLMIGDAAPPMPVKYYLRRDRPEKFEKGRPYVVEFWATWCVPCVANFPRLTELQKKYKDRVTIIAVSVWEPRPHEVPSFIDKQGERMGFLAAMDDVPPAPPETDNPSEWAKHNGTMSVTWLRAAGADGIPTTFVVDAHDRIAWIGNPVDMEDPLHQIVNGTWDMNAFAEIHRTKMRLRARAQPLQVRQFQARHKQDWPAAIVALDELLALDPSFASYAATKFEVLLTGVKDTKRAYDFAREAIVGVARDSSDGLNRIAATIVNNPDNAELDVALAASVRAEVVTQGKDSNTLATLASVHAARGDFARAIESQRRAIAHTDADSKPELERKLAEYEARAAGR